VRTRVAAVNFDTYRNLQRHRVVLPAIARLSCISVCILVIKFCVVADKWKHRSRISDCSV